jgi:hypothetical protein
MKQDPDLIALAERIIAATEAAGEETLTIPTHTARALLDMAKGSKKPRGRQRTMGRARVREAVALAEGRRRKKQLAAGGMKKGAAHQQAAEEQEAKLRKDRNLAASTIKRRME